MLSLAKTSIQKLARYRELMTEKLGEVAKETVKEKFLIPSLLRDYLKVFKELI